MTAQDTLARGTHLGHGALGMGVLGSGFQLNAQSPDLKGVANQKPLAGGIDVSALKRFAVPGPANLHAILRRHKVEIGGMAGIGVLDQIEDGKADLSRRSTGLKHRLKPGIEGRALAVHNALSPQARFIGERAQRLTMILVQRFKPDEAI